MECAKKVTGFYYPLSPPNEETHVSNTIFISCTRSLSDFSYVSHITCAMPAWNQAYAVIRFTWLTRSFHKSQASRKRENTVNFLVLLPFIAVILSFSWRCYSIDTLLLLFLLLSLLLLLLSLLLYYWSLELWL